MTEFLHDPNFLALLCGAAAFVVVVLIWSAFLENDVLSERLKAVAERRDELQQALTEKKSRRDVLKQADLMKKIVNWFKLAQGKSMADVRLKLQRAGYRSRDAMFAYLATKFLLLVGLLAVSIFFIFILKTGTMKFAMRLCVVTFAALLGWMLPDLFLKNVTQKREALLRKAMPDALDLLVICAEAGLSLDSGFERVSREMGASAPDLAEEMGLASVELSFLPERTKALQGLSERVGLPGMQALVNTLIQTEKYGTPLAHALRILSHEMREERIMKAEEKAARLPATMTVPMILFILPPLFIVLIGPAIINVMKILHH